MAVTKNIPKQTDDSMRLQDLFSLCLYRWKWFVLSLVCSLGLAVLYLLTSPPIYTRSTSILIKEDSKGQSSFSSEINSFADMGLFNVNTNVNNELTSIKSPALVLEVVKRLHLDMNYKVDGAFHKNTLYSSSLPVTATIIGVADNDFCTFTLELKRDGKFKLFECTLNGEDLPQDKHYSGNLNDTIQTSLGPILIKPTPFYNNDELTLYVSRSGLVSSVENYSSRLTASLDNEKNTIINLSYQDVSIRRAEEFLNTLISIYNENWVKDKNQIAVSTSQFIDERLSIIEQELGNVDNDISSYKSDHLIPDVQAASTMYMHQANEAGTQIMGLNNELYMIRYVRNFITNESNNNQLLPANTGINSSTIERQISEYNEKMLQRNSLVANSSVLNPLVIDLDKALSSIRQAIVVSIDNQIGTLNTRIKSLRTNEQQSTARIASNPTQTKYLLSVERQQKVKESLYLFLLQKREENELSQAFTAYNTRVITPPSGKLEPTSPVRRNVLLLSFLFGLLLPVVVIIVMENSNTKVRGRKDLKKLTIPFIGEIPQTAGNKKSKRPNGSREQANIVVKEGYRDVINEAFRVLRTNLEFMTENGKDFNVIILTSYNPGSGKSFLALNIGISLAIKEKRVLVIDGDLRHGSTSSYIDSPETGLSDYLNGRGKDIHDIIIADKTHECLHILPIGTLPPNPTELLFNSRMKQIIDIVRNEYDYVFIDCPPIDLVADAQILEKLADRTIFVIRAGLLERSMLEELESLYTEKRYKNMAIILNGTSGDGNRYGYKYGYRYGYRYGYHYSNPSKKQVHTLLKFLSCGRLQEKQDR